MSVQEASVRDLKAPCEQQAAATHSCAWGSSRTPVRVGLGMLRSLSMVYSWASAPVNQPKSAASIRCERG